MQDKWGKFEEEVDDVVPLAVREVGLEPGGWVENYTKEELRKVQLEDEIVGKVLRWLELGGEPQREELLLADPAVKYFWRFKENLAIRGGVLKYKWMSGIDRWLLVVPEILWHSLGVHWRFIQIKGGILRVSSLKRCVNC